MASRAGATCTEGGTRTQRLCVYTEHLTVRTHAHIFLVKCSQVMRDVWLKGWSILCVCAKSFHLLSCLS